MNIKKPKLGDMVRVTHIDNGGFGHKDYESVFLNAPFHLITRGRFIGSVNGCWFIECQNILEMADLTNMVEYIIESCITEVKNFGHDDSPLPEDLDTLLKEAGGK